MKKVEEAIAKIKEEMEKSKVPYIQAIGNYIVVQVEINDEAAKEIISGEKTLEKALAKVKGEARKKAINGCAVLTDEEVYKLVKEYYGFIAEQPNATKIVINEDATFNGPVKAEEKEKPKTNFSVDLKSLLGGKR